MDEKLLLNQLESINDALMPIITHFARYNILANSINKMIVEWNDSNHRIDEALIFHRDLSLKWTELFENTNNCWFDLNHFFEEEMKFLDLLVQNRNNG